MADLAISVQSISKRYRIGRRSRYLAMHEALEEGVRAPFRGLSSWLNRSASGSADRDYVWALQDVSFQVSRGEVLGVVGPNGAGKSVLLKILARVTKPIQGHAEVHGRVGSILEVGAGFHPELTGRENIYLNGAVLGMKRAEIGRRFADIVAFSDVEDFLDTPMKHYSDGMRVRLSFAIAAHLNAEILLVDEVLAVADESFQQKCLTKLQQAAAEGRTVLLVSHNMGVIKSLCPRTMFLDEGRVRMDGDTLETVSCYLAHTRGQGSHSPHTPG